MSSLQPIQALNLGIYILLYKTYSTYLLYNDFPVYACMSEWNFYEV